MKADHYSKIRFEQNNSLKILVLIFLRWTKLGSILLITILRLLGLTKYNVLEK